MSEGPRLPPGFTDDQACRSLSDDPGYVGAVEADDSAVKKARAASHVRDVLGIEPTADALLARLASQLGPSEIGPILEGIRHSSPDRREYAVAGVAAASLAMDHLGSGWWTTRRHRFNLAELPEDDGSPADLIRSRPRLRQPGETGPWIDPPAEVLGYWAEDDVADHLWGQPVAYVDMNSSQPVDRVPAPASARVGDRLVLTFDPGSRIDAVVERRLDGTLGTRLDMNSLRSSPPADLWWNWLAATKLGPAKAVGT